MAPVTGHAVTLAPLEGHDDARRSLLRARAGGRLPAVLLLHGAPGVGKQRFALWLAQLLFCNARSGQEEPCGECRECRLVARIEHPDLHWYMPLTRPSARGSKEREAEALEDARIEWIEEFRETPLRSGYSDETTGLHLGTVRNLRKRARGRPALGDEQLFLIAGAEELVSQEASQEAANALLKLLEEPPEGTRFVLTSSEPGRLLATIRSRSTPLHLAPLAEDRVASFLKREADADAEDAAHAAALAGGAIGRALGFLPDGDEDGPLEQLRRDSFKLLRAALGPTPRERFARALSYPPAGARGLHELLTSLEGWLRDLAAARSGAESLLLNRDAAEWLVKTASDDALDPLGPARAVTAVEEARALAAGNVNPQLLLHGLLARLHRELRPAPVSASSGR